MDNFCLSSVKEIAYVHWMARPRPQSSHVTFIVSFASQSSLHPQVTSLLFQHDDCRYRALMHARDIYLATSTRSTHPITEDGPPRRRQQKTRLWVRGDVNISTGGCIFSCSLTIIRSHPALYLSETRTFFAIIIKDSGKSTPRSILLAAVAFIDGVTALFSLTTQKVMKDREQVGKGIKTTRILSQSPPPSYSLHFWPLPFVYLPELLTKLFYLNQLKSMSLWLRHEISLKRHHATELMTSL